jgi:hypothetical protein
MVCSRKPRRFVIRNRTSKGTCARTDIEKRSSGASLRIYASANEPVNPETAELIRDLIGSGVRVDGVPEDDEVEVARPDIVWRDLSAAQRRMLTITKFGSGDNHVTWSACRTWRVGSGRPG